MTENRLGYREIALFFFPLLLNVQLMSISHTIINGALARIEDYVTALAGISVAVIIHVFISSPSYQNHTVTIAMARGRRSLLGVLLFIGLVAAYVSTMLFLIGYTPIGDLVLIKLLGTPPDVAHEAVKALRIMVFLPFFTGIRGFFQGLLIRARRTVLVSLATGVRVAALLIYLSIGSWWFSGAQLGAFALVSCVITETLAIGWLGWKIRMPLVSGEQDKSVRKVLRYAFPLAYSSCLQQTIPLLISSIIGRLSDGPLALAAFGVIRGFLFLLAGPMRNLQQAYMTLVKNQQDYRQLINFSLIVSVVMGLLIILTAGPFNQVILGRILGVEPELRHYLRWSLAGCALFPLFYGLSNLLRGWFSSADLTAQLGRSTIIKSAFLLLLWWPLVAAQPKISGIVIGIALLILAEIIEAFYLFHQRSRRPEELRRLAPN